MNYKWVIRNKPGDVQAVAAEQGISPYVARVLLNRGLDTKERRDVYLHPSVYGLRDGKELLNAEKAALLLKEAIASGKSIRIIGDYDVDGITSTYVLYKALSEAGANVSFKIPHRILDGYGINRAMIDEAVEDEVQVILTCDNGISERETIAYAKSLGLTVIVTDHHDIAREDGKQLLPPADVIVNPKQDGETNAFTGYCGCVVAMKVIEAMGADITPYLPYAAMATLCDVMDLQDENRTIVVLGLSEIRRTRDTGLRALIEANKLDPERVSAYHIGFVIGPCLNASGRLQTAELALNLLLETDPISACDEAEELVALNTDRKAMTEEGVERARFILETVAKIRAEEAGDSDWEKYIDKIIIVYLEDCHESIAGIIAGRIRGLYYRPTFILTNAGEEGVVKGSGRSIEGWSMFEEMSKEKDMFLRFGGHPMAAGLSMLKENVEELQQRFNESCTLSEEDFAEKIKIDAKLPFNLVNMELIDQLALIEPTGKGNDKPLFAEKDLRIKRVNVIGKNQNVLKLKLQNTEGYNFEGVYFGDIPGFYDMIKKRFGEEQLNRVLRGQPNDVLVSATYVPERNDYNGMVTLQAKITNFKVF